MTAHLSAALAYAQRGWRVVPSWHILADGSCACPRGRGKLPGQDPDACDKQGKHPRLKDWTNVATKDPQSITEWWGQWPDANVSIVTGIASGIFVVDVDPRHDGDASVDDYDRNTEMGLPLTLTARTGGGGRHLFYRYPQWLGSDWVIGNLVNWLPGVDIRGEGGQVVAPPSPHVSGEFYTWAAGWEEGPAEPPEELVRMILSAAGEKGRSGGSSGEPLPEIGDMLTGVPEGERNDVLFRKACQLRRQLGEDRAAVELFIRAAGRASGVSEGELDTLLDSAFRQNHDDEFTVAASSAAWAAQFGAAASVGMTETVGPDDAVRAAMRPGPPSWVVGEPFPLNDVGNAMRMAGAFGGELKWSEAGWSVWDGVRWARDTTKRHRDYAQKVSGLVLAEADYQVSNGDGDPSVLVKWAAGCHSSAKISSLLREVEPMLAVPTDIWDSDPWLFNTTNGTLDLRSLQSRPHSREDLLTKVGASQWLGAVPAPMWRAFVEKVLPDPTVRWFVQKAVGYSLTGVVDAKVLFILHGSGNNGKSVFLETLRETVFGDYAATAGKDVIMQSRNAQHETGLAKLAGARFVTLSEEVAATDRLNTSLLKSMTGGDQIQARFMREDHFEFTPQLKLWIGTNHKPGLTDFGAALRSRLRMIPWTYTFGPDERRDASEVKREFQAEASGILAWAIEGLYGYLAERLDEPSVMAEVVDDWMDDDDTVARFLADRTLPAETYSEGATASELHQAYVGWAALFGEVEISRRTFVRDLDSRQMAMRKATKGETRRYSVKVKSVNQYGL